MDTSAFNYPAATVAMVAVLFIFVFGIFVIRSTRHTGLGVIMGGALAAFLAVLFATVVVPYLSDMQPPPPDDLRPFNIAELEGRSIYLREGCYYCHSQFVRPNDRDLGPVSQASDYYYDSPAALGTQRTGPDLSNVGGRFGDEYHRRHHTDPRDARPGSLMPPFPWLNDNYVWEKMARNEDGVKTVHAGIERAGNIMSGGLRFLREPRVVDRRDPERPMAIGGGWDKPYLYYSTAYKWAEQPEEKGRIYLYTYDPRRPEGYSGQVPVGRYAKDGWRRATENDVLSTYLQSMGTRKPMRPNPEIPDRFYYEFNEDTGEREVRHAESSISFAPKFIVQGRGIYMDKCAHCHGNNGDGKGPAGRDWIKRPANFTEAKFKTYTEPMWFWRISEGVPGTQMPQWQLILSEDQRWWVARYLQYVAKVDRKLISGTDEYIAEQQRMSGREAANREKDREFEADVEERGADAVNVEVGAPEAEVSEDEIEIDLE